MPKRKPLSKRTRFEVFKRDGFTCVYCGRTPPSVKLHVDHLTAVANGGGDNMDNLFTSCADCNLGKGAVPIDQVWENIVEVMADRMERRQQLNAYDQFLWESKQRREMEADAVHDVFQLAFPGYVLKDSFVRQIANKFLESLPAQDVIDAMEYACDYIDDDREAAIRYFCGICWRKIKGDGRHEK